MTLDAVRSNAQSYMDLLVKSKKKEEEEDSQTGKFSEMMAGFLNGVKDEAAAAAASAAVPPTVKTQTDSSQSTSVPVPPGGTGAGGADKAYDPSEAVIQKLLDDPDFASKSINEMAAGLDEDFESYGDRFMEPYVESGVHFAQRQSVWTVQMISPPMQIPQPKNGNFTLNDPAWAEFHAEIERRQQPEYLEMMRKRQESLDAALRERVDSGVADQLNAEWEQLATRASLVKAARSIDGFAAEYAADPSATVRKYSEELNRYMQSTSVSMREGVTTCSY